MPSPDHVTGRDTRLFRRAAVAAAVLTAAGVAITVTRAGGTYAGRFYVDVVSTLAMLAAAALCVRRARRASGRDRLGWSLIAAGGLSWSVLGSPYWDYYELVLRETPPFPAVSDIGFLGLPLLASLGMLAFAGTAFGARTTLRRALDGVIVGASVAFLQWHFVLGPAFAGRAGDFLTQAVSLAYPIGDLAVFVLVLALLPGVARRAAVPLTLLGGGLFAMAASDTLWVYLISQGTYVGGGVADMGWVVGPLLVAMAAAHPPPAARATLVAEPAPSRVAALLPIVPLLAVVAVIVAAFVRGGALPPFLFWGGVGIAALVGTRQTLAFQDNIALTHRVRDTSRELAAKVAELEAAYDRIKELDGIKTMFLNTAAHELNTPLTPVRLQLRMLRTQGAAGLTDKQRRSLDVMDRNVTRLVKLARDILDVARMESGRLSLDYEPVDLTALVHDVVESFEATAAHAGIALEADVDAGLAVEADPHRLGQVLFNLLSNALKFTPAGGRVGVRATLEGDHAVLEVRDSGAGLTAHQRSQLFKPFSQVHDPSTTKVGGTGLGLFISKSLVERHGGSMGCASEGPGRGSSFWFRLPATKWVTLKDPAPQEGTSPASA